MRLDEFTTANAVPQYSCAITPGKHCPLFGVTAALRGVAGITLIYIGTQDCVYYAQKDVLTRHMSAKGRASAHFRTLAVQLSDSDLIFGIRPQLEKLLKKESSREETKAIYLVTSCSIEVLSEDLQSVVRTVAGRTGKKITLIPTENFKTFSYYQGIQDALTALTTGITPYPTVPKTFAVLGARQPGADKCEPVRYLTEHGYTLQSILPYDTDLDRIEHLSSVEFTLVLDSSGLGVAETLQSDFNIPYVRFDQHLDLEAITDNWQKLASLTGKDLSSWISSRLEEICRLKEKVSALVSGKTFFYGQKVIYPFESCLFLTDLGMTPTCIFLGSALDKSDDARQMLLKRANPILWQNASQAAIKSMLEENLPDYVFGITGGVVSNYPVKAMQFQINPVPAGFTYYITCLNDILTLAETEDKP